MLLKPTKTGDVKTDKALDDIRGELRKAVKASHLYLFGNQGLPTNTTTRYFHPGYEDATANTGEKYQAALHDGRLENLRVVVGAGADTSGTLLVVVRVNSKDTTLAVNIEQKASGVFAPREPMSIPVKAGDKLSVSAKYSVAPATAAANLVVNFELVY